MSKEKLAQVFHFDLYGKREDKYDFLNENSMNTIDWNTLEPKAPNHFFVKKDFEVQEIYDEGFSVNNLMPCNSVGIVTARDNFSIHNTKIELENTIKEFLSLDDETARRRFNLGKDARDWQVNFAKKDLNEYYPNKGFFSKISYRPFDVRNTFYTGKSKGFHCYPRNEVMKHFLKDNIGLAGIRHNKEDYYSSVFITKFITEARLSDRFITNIFPLYLYPETTTQQSLLNEVVRIPNLNMEMVQKMADGLGLKFVTEKTTPPAGGGHPSKGELQNSEIAPIDILDYIYAVLHSPTYRETYKEFLKIDFPRAPYPTDVRKFWELVALGGELRQLHLLESETVENYITQYPEDGDNIVAKPKFVTSVQLNSPPLEGCPPSADGVVGKVYINDTQYFNNVPEIAWNFYIGGYQPAQKWLKDRKERELSFEDILHYQKMILALFETDRIMKEIDKIEI